MPSKSQKSTYCIKMNIKGTLVVRSRIDKDSAALLFVPPQKKALSIPGPVKRAGKSRLIKYRATSEARSSADVLAHELPPSLKSQGASVRESTS